MRKRKVRSQMQQTFPLCCSPSAFGSASWCAVKAICLHDISVSGRVRLQIPLQLAPCASMQVMLHSVIRLQREHCLRCCHACCVAMSSGSSDGSLCPAFRSVHDEMYLSALCHQLILCFADDESDEEEDDDDEESVESFDSASSSEASSQAGSDASEAGGGNGGGGNGGGGDAGGGDTND